MGMTRQGRLLTTASALLTLGWLLALTVGHGSEYAIATAASTVTFWLGYTTGKATR